MRWRTHLLLWTAVTVPASPSLLTAAESPLGQDLTATIVLHGLPCDKVIEAKRNGDSDYTASCRDGNRYHVYVDSTGRVVVKKI